MIGFGIAMVLDLVGLLMGLSDDGFGWAFKMPSIALSGLAALTASIGGLILGILRLMHMRGRDVATWCVVAALVATGLGGAILIFMALAASASV